MIESFFFERYLVTTLAGFAFIIFVLVDCVENRSIMLNFVWATLSVLILVLAEVLENYYAGFDHPVVWRYIFSALGYSARPAIAFFVLMVPARKHKPRLARWLFIPAAVNALVSFSSLISPLAFSYDAGNSFHRGPLGYTTFVVAAIYLLMLLGFCLQRMRRGETADTVICTCAIAMCVLGVYLEYRLNHAGTLPAMALYGEIFYFMYLLISKYSTDYLTGAYVRSHLYREVESRSRFRFYITFDVNGLKRINDEHGHAAGDAALVTFSRAVNQALPTRALFYRLGGDEFAIILRTGREQDVKELIVRIRSLCGNMPYGFSSGYASFTGASNFDACAARADELLYADKTAFWESYDKTHRPAES